jgi:hypothetical protein
VARLGASAALAAATKTAEAAAPIGAWALREGAKAAGKAAVGLVASAWEGPQQQAQQQQRRQLRQDGRSGKEVLPAGQAAGGKSAGAGAAAAAAAEAAQAVAEAGRSKEEGQGRGAPAGGGDE